MQFWWEGAALCWQWIEWLGIFAKIDSLGFSFLPFTFSKLQRQMRQGWNIAGTQPPQLSLWGGGGSPPALDWCHHHPPISPPGQLSHPPSPTTMTTAPTNSNWADIHSFSYILLPRRSKSMTMAGDLDLSSLPKIPVKPHPPHSNSSSVVDCMWSPSFPHPWLLAHCNERLFYSPPLPHTYHYHHTHPPKRSKFIRPFSQEGGEVVKGGKYPKSDKRCDIRDFLCQKGGNSPLSIMTHQSLEVCVWIKVKQMSSVDI